MFGLRTVLVGLLLLLAPCAAVLCAEEKQQALPSVFIEVRADREEAVYGVGETITFRVTTWTCEVRGNQAIRAKDATPVAGVELAYRITGDGGYVKTGKLTSALEPVTIECSLDRPGFVLCEVGEAVLSRWWQYKGRGGAGVDPLKIEAGVVEPEDFDAFWKDALDELGRIPMTDVKLVKQDTSTEEVAVYAVHIPTLGAGPDNVNPFVIGYLSKPANAAPRSSPAMLHLPGAGVRSPRLMMDHVAKHGVIELSIGVHGLEVGQPAEYYQQQRDPVSAMYKIVGDDKDQARRNSYFRTIFMRVARSLQYLKSLPEWDGKTLIINGGSQGGGLSLIGAALDPQVTACMANYPGFCDQYGYLRQQANGWPQMIRFDKEGKPTNPMAAQIAAYFDAANFARRINVDVVVTNGFIDTTCPPTSVYAAYNRIPAANKQIINGVTNGHEGPKWDRQAFVERHLAAQKTTGMSP